MGWVHHHQSNLPGWSVCFLGFIVGRLVWIHKSRIMSGQVRLLDPVRVFTVGLRSYAGFQPVVNDLCGPLQCTNVDIIHFDNDTLKDIADDVVPALTSMEKRILISRLKYIRQHLEEEYNPGNFFFSILICVAMCCMIIVGVFQLPSILILIHPLLCNLYNLYVSQSCECRIGTSTHGWW